MKRKLFAAFVVIGALSLTACQEDATMNDLVVDTQADTELSGGNNGGAGGAGSNGNGSGGVGGSN